MNRLAPSRRKALGAGISFVILLVLVIVGAKFGGGAPGPADHRERGSASDPVSGLPFVDLDRLPAEAQDTVKLIKRGGPFPYDKDGATFGNREGILPIQKRGFYKEYTVSTPGEDDRGARRIVTGDDDQKLYYTEDHYDSFERIKQ